MELPEANETVTLKLQQGLQAEDRIKVSKEFGFLNPEP